MKFLFDIHKQKNHPFKKYYANTPPILSHLLNKKVDIFLFKIKKQRYVLFDKIEGMILL